MRIASTHSRTRHLSVLQLKGYSLIEPVPWTHLRKSKSCTLRCCLSRVVLQPKMYAVHSSPDTTCTWPSCLVLCTYQTVTCALTGQLPVHYLCNYPCTCPCTNPCTATAPWLPFLTLGNRPQAPLPCGIFSSNSQKNGLHTPCFVQADATRCTAPCGGSLDCGHTCQHPCGACLLATLGNTAAAGKRYALQVHGFGLVAMALPLAAPDKAVLATLTCCGSEISCGLSSTG